jgi:hypothetical protein
VRVNLCELGLAGKATPAAAAQREKRGHALPMASGARLSDIAIHVYNTGNIRELRLDQPPFDAPMGAGQTRPGLIDQRGGHSLEGH